MAVSLSCSLSDAYMSVSFVVPRAVFAGCHLYACLCYRCVCACAHWLMQARALVAQRVSPGCQSAIQHCTPRRAHTHLHHTQACMHTLHHMRKHACVHAPYTTHTSMHVCMHTYTPHTQACMCACTPTPHTQACMCACTLHHTRKHACVHAPYTACVHAPYTTHTSMHGCMHPTPHA